MDRSGQQLRYSNGMVNSVALRSESTIGYCEMYSSKNTCLCMTVRDKNSEFGNLPACNGMCMKQNINIYIENYETGANSEKYDLKCNSKNIETFPYYKEEKLSAINNLYIGRNLSNKWCETSSKPDNIGNWESSKNSSNIAYYPYLNTSRPYIAESAPCVKDQKESKPSINQVEVNISPVVENSLLYNEINKKYACRGKSEKDKGIAADRNASIIVSGAMPPSACNNLYVAPPYFTVDKFVNQEQSDNKEGSQFCSRNFYNYQKVPPSIGIDYTSPKNHLIQSSEKQLVKLVDNPNIPLMHLETSIEPVGLDISKRNRYLPIKKEIGIYDKRYNTEKIDTFQPSKNPNVNLPYNSELNTRIDFVQNKGTPLSFTIDQCDGGINSIESENPNLCAGIGSMNSAYSSARSSRHNIALHDMQYVQYHKNSAHEVCIKKSYSNLISPSTKSLIREARKPNYRELINHAHALRNATSEDDLNMQIIKRTLNYNPQPKDVPVSNTIPRNHDQKTSRRNVDTAFLPDQNCKVFEPAYENKAAKPYEPRALLNVTTSFSPLDLSVKTIKTKADSTENSSSRKVLMMENGYPPKFNFRPNFSDNRSVISNVECINIDANGKVSNSSDVNQSHFDLGSKPVTDPAVHFTKRWNQLEKIKENSIEFGLNKDLMLHGISKPKINNNTVNSLQNCITPQMVPTCVSQETEHGAGIKLEVNLKRTIPFKRSDDNECLNKKPCLEGASHLDFKTSRCEKYSKSPDDNLKKEIHEPPQSVSNINHFNDSLNRHIKQLITEVHKDIKHETLPQIEVHQSFMKSKQDVSSIIAARIRTKAELKGFTFQDDKSVFDQKNKENCHCNYGSLLLAEKEEVDLSNWENTCNNFVDQLIDSFSKSHVRIKESKSYENLISHPLPELSEIKNENEANMEINESKSLEKISSSEHIDESKDASVTKISDSATFSSKTCSLAFQKMSDTNGNDNKFLLQKTDLKCNEPKANDCNTSESITKISACSDGDKTNHENDHKKNFLRNSKMCALVPVKYETKSKEKKLVKSNLKAIDLTKISVVRLKREKYPSKRYIQNEKTAENNRVQICKAKDDLVTKKHLNKVGRSFCSITKSSTKQRSLECLRRKDTVKESIETKISTITTRLRHKKLQLQNKIDFKDKSNKVHKPKTKKLRMHRCKNSSEREDRDKLYLEVYRYKRALKIPPNLISIKNSCTQRMSTSLPDLDLDIQNPLLKTEGTTNSSSSDRKKDDVPKSFIDVLHSRVIKSKNQLNANPKYSKSDKKHSSKSTIEQCNTLNLNFKPLNLSDNNNHSNEEYRNVFETQVLSSRTRTEYKMQLNKEVIREIFGSSERPASAPPEINNSSDYQLVLGQYNKCFQELSSDIENDIKYQTENEQLQQHRVCGQESSDASIYSKNVFPEQQTKDTDQSANLVKSKRKRNGRPYRRKFSSGFDYLRKRKKSNTHGSLFNYSHMKTKATNYLPEVNLQLKSENDVSREIQKWVLNKSVGQSALHKAARLGYIDVIVYCIERMGLNPDHKDNAGYTPLHDACVNGSLEIVRVLLQYGANHSEGAHSGIRPLHEASENGHMEIVRMLLSYGADPLLETYSGQTPLMLAAEPEMNEFISMHLLDVQMSEIRKNTWKFPGPWKIFDDTENGYDVFNGVSSVGTPYHIDGKISKQNFVCADFYYLKERKNNSDNSIVSEINMMSNKNNALKNDVCEFEIVVDATDAEGELFEFEEANMPLPPLYLLKDEGMEKWVLLSDLCSLLKVKSKDTLLHKIFPSISPAAVSRAFIRELKMCEFLEKATCLQLLCAGEKINICHSKVVLVQYNENVRKLLGVKTILMKF